MRIDNTTTEHRNMERGDVVNLLNGGATMRSVRVTERQGGRYGDLKFTVITEPSSVRDSRLRGLVSRGVGRMTVGIPSLHIGRSERNLIRKLCNDIITEMTSRLLSFTLDGDCDYLDNNMIDSNSEDMVDEVIDKIIIGLNAGDTLSELREKLSDDVKREIWSVDY